MFRPFLHRVLSVALMLAVSGLAAQPSDDLADEKELEIQVLTTISGSERGAKRMHRTIERYRAHQERALEKMAEREDGRPYTAHMRARLAYSNMVKSYAPNEKRVISRLTSGLLDIAEYLDAVEASETYVPPYMEELVVIGSIFDHMPMDPAEFSVEEIKQMRNERREANQLFRDGHYVEA